MTSTPTACPECVKFYGDYATYHCRHKSVTVCADVDCSVEHPTGKPRQPDTSARTASYEWSAANPTKRQVDEIFNAGADWGHAQATAQMGATVPILWHAHKMSELITKVTTAQEQLAAAELRADAYEKALEHYSAAVTRKNGLVGNIAHEALAAHKRGGGNV